MKTKTLRRNKVNVVTLGCSKNLVDSEELMGQLRAGNFEVEHESGSGDHQVVIINTCGFIESAKQESIDTILRFAVAKKEGLVEKLYVTGCLSERYRKDLETEIPEVDAYFGTREMPALLKKLKADYKKELIGERLLTTPKHFAYFKISEGCDRPCSFCAIPLMRGGHRSVPMEELVKRAAMLSAGGTKELLLIAQDLTYYGLDIYGKRKLAELLQVLSEVQGIEWIRLHYAFPGGFPLEVLDVIRTRSNICNYIDIPLQHISNNMLKSMRRGITKEKTIELIGIIREKVPGIAIRTTVMTGYPGETEKDHEEMLEWVGNMRFDRLGVFTYSHEDGTHAHKLADNVPAKTKKMRADAVMSLQQEISLDLNRAKIGKQFRVLTDRIEGGLLVGRTEFDSPEVDNEVLIKNFKSDLRPGDFVEVIINSAEDFDLHGELIH